MPMSQTRSRTEREGGEISSAVPTPGSPQHRICAQQAETLRLAGASIRHTFIEISAHTPRQQEQRASSVPPSAWSNIEREKCAGLYDIYNQVEEDDDYKSDVSTEAGDLCDHHAADPAEAEAEGTGLAAADELVERTVRIISTEFSYLKMCRHSLQQAPASSRPAHRSSTTATLIFFMQGLPRARHNKWRHPLLRAFAAVLAKNGVHARMASGKLRVWSEHGQVFKVDISATNLGKDRSRHTASATGTWAPAGDTRHTRTQWALQAANGFEHRSP